MEGRNSICIYCGRGYFRDSALTQHVKWKHLDEDSAYDYLKSLRLRNTKSFTLPGLSNQIEEHKGEKIVTTSFHRKKDESKVSVLT